MKFSSFPLATLLMALTAGSAAYVAPHSRWSLLLLTFVSYQTRYLEAILGSHRLALHTAVLALLLRLIPHTASHVHVGLTGALITHFMALVPMSGHAQSMWLYLAALQVASENPIAAVVGAVLAGVWLHVPFLMSLSARVSRLLRRVVPLHVISGTCKVERFPAVLARPVDDVGGAVYHEQLLPMPWQRQQQQQQANVQRPHRAAQPQQAPPPSAPTAPRDQDVHFLMELGYDREDCVRALQMTGNNLEAASNMLLDHH
eukprot:PhM_4_TR15025/c0_g2_i1/m.6911